MILPGARNDERPVRWPNYDLLELVFVDIKTNEVVFAITNIEVINYITSTSVGYNTTTEPYMSCRYSRNEQLEIHRVRRS